MPQLYVCMCVLRSHTVWWYVRCSMCVCIVFRSYTLGDMHIGLSRSAAPCNCDGASFAACEACRASWSWYDGTAMNWWNWQQEEPNEFACGRLSSDGWAENDCAEELRYICQRGKALCQLRVGSCMQTQTDNLKHVFSQVMFEYNYITRITYKLCYWCYHTTSSQKVI